MLGLPKAKHSSFGLHQERNGPILDGINSTTKDITHFGLPRDLESFQRFFGAKCESPSESFEKVSPQTSLGFSWFILWYGLGWGLLLGAIGGIAYIWVSRKVVLAETDSERLFWRVMRRGLKGMYPCAFLILGANVAVNYLTNTPLHKKWPVLCKFDLEQPINKQVFLNIDNFAVLGKGAGALAATAYTIHMFAPLVVPAISFFGSCLITRSLGATNAYFALMNLAVSYVSSSCTYNVYRHFLGWDLKTREHLEAIDAQDAYFFGMSNEKLIESFGGMEALLQGHVAAIRKHVAPFYQVDKHRTKKIVETFYSERPDIVNLYQQGMFN